MSEPSITKSHEIFQTIDDELSVTSTGYSSSEEQEYNLQGSLEDHSLEIKSEDKSSTPSAETIERLKAAVEKETPAENKSENIMDPTNNERSKFGISSLISRMSRAENSSFTSSGRKEPSLNQENFAQSDNDLSDKSNIEVPAFLRRQAN